MKKPLNLSIKHTREKKDLQERSRPKNAPAERIKIQDSILMNLIRDAILILDADFHIQHWNKGAEQMYGWNEEEVAGRISYELFETDSGNFSPDLIIPELIDKGFYRSDFTHKTKNGIRIDVQTSASVIKDEQDIFSGIVLIIKDISENKRNEIKLKELSKNLQDQVSLQTKELTSIFERVTDGFVAFDKNWAITYINKKAGELFERDPESLIGKNFWAEFPEAVGLPFFNAYHEAMKTQVPAYLQEYYQPFNRWYENHIYPSPHGLSIYFRDVTDKKHTEKDLEKAGRLYHFISSINQMIVRTSDQETLFNETCRIAVEVGKFKLAWIGTADPKTKAIIPLVYKGEEQGFFDVVKFSADTGVPGGTGPSARAFEEGLTSVSNDIANDPKMVLSHEALKRGFHAAIALPIRRLGKVIANFSLYAGQPHFFDEQEIKLLEEATNDISFALDFIEKEAMRKRTQDSLIKSERRYQSLTEISPVGVFHTNKEGLVTYVNKRWCSIAGMSFTEALGYGWQKALFEEDKELLLNSWIRSIQDGASNQFDFRLQRPDGTIAWVLGQSIPEKDSQNQIIGYVGTITDITERKNIELEIIKEKYLSESVIDNLPGIFYMINQKGRFIRWNRNFEEVMGYDAAEIEKMNRLDLAIPAEKEMITRSIRDSITSGRENTLTHFITKKELIIPFHLTGMAIEYNGEPCLIVMGIDFSERARIQEEMNQTSRQLQALTDHLQTIREEERKRIGRELHDELGQQLTAMKMDIAWINKKTPDESGVVKDKIKEVISLLDGSNTALRRILNELRPTILDQHGLLDALQWHARQFSSVSNIPLEIRTAEKEIRVRDEIATCIFRVFQESLTNITRYSKARNVVTSIGLTDNDIIIDIEDDGVGFDTGSEQPKSRQPFGILGMKERVRALQGKFELNSAPGKGTKIHISLPLQ